VWINSQKKGQKAPIFISVHLFDVLSLCPYRIFPGAFLAAFLIRPAAPADSIFLTISVKKT
jgi:hypothetical protein